MKSKTLKSFLYSLLIILAVFIILMLTPRTIALISPDRKPVGYHFLAADYLAIGVGLEKLINKTPAVPDDIQEIKDIEYRNINGKSLQLDMYIPKNLAGPAPLLVFIHGGGWKGGQRQDYLVYLIAFAKKGYVTATVSYRLLGDAPYPACAEDITEAVRWFHRNGSKYGYDPDRIAVIGGSAGAHLAMLAGYGWKKRNAEPDTTGIPADYRPVKAVVEIYGPTDLTTEYARNHPLVTGFLAQPYDKDPGLYEEASPIFHLDGNDPPTMILHGTSDNLVPVSQAYLLKERLDSLGVPAVIYCLPLWPHTMDIVQRVNDYSQKKMTEFFEKYLN